ncbi:tail fiber protein [Mycobacterium phage Quesadilla]|uniref:Minor tail protein gp31 C-terminal domain-containing protein n=1 Tax=Mycobacterium phage Quesadilla TaxID=2664226 RepID=A0A5Q2W9T7_9CAUD|nr:tail fiber protein [Mycobacterium phage Quesadilla]QGH75291.1 hypothetical protein SEA_QUESADILLA_43 [Mycobacterium phage Quesadilla]
MAITSVFFDTAAAAGSKFDPEVAAEIEHLAPGLAPGEVGEAELADHAVSKDKIKAGAVGTTEIAEGGVEAQNMANDSVPTAALQDDSVTAAKAGLGVSTAYDAAGNPIEDKRVYLTTAQYNALGVKDPNTTYYIS